MSSGRLRQEHRPAPGPEVPLQRAFRLDDLRHVRLAARRAGNPFFTHACIDPDYARVVFCGRGLLFAAYHTQPRPSWRVYLAFFAPMNGGAWFSLLPHADEHAHAAAVRLQAEDLAARMHTRTWQQALGLFVARTGRPGRRTVSEQARYTTHAGSLPARQVRTAVTLVRT